MRADIYDRLIAEAEKWGGVAEGQRFIYDKVTWQPIAPCCVIGMAQSAGILTEQEPEIYPAAEQLFGFDERALDRAIIRVQINTSVGSHERVPLPLVFAELGITREEEPTTEDET